MASPGNLEEDRKKVFEIVKNINLDSGQREGFVAEIVSWETHTRPAVGEYSQGVINDQFPDDIDIFIGMMGTHFGTPTKYWGSGTEEEFRIAHERWKETKTPEIMFYFSDAMSSLNRIDPEQLAKRNSFREDIANLGVYYFTYTDVTEFQFDLFRHISSAVRQALKEKEIGVSEEVTPQESSTNLKSFNDLLAYDPLVNAVFMLGKATKHLEAHTKTQLALYADVQQLSKSLNAQARNLNRARENRKQKQIVKAFDATYSALSDYASELTIKVPRLSAELSSAIIYVLRVAELLVDNKLQGKVPLIDMLSNIIPMRAALVSLVGAIETTDAAFLSWARDNLDIDIQLKMISALHEDLVSGLSQSIGLLDRLTNELT